MIYYNQIWTRKSHGDSTIRFVTAKSWLGRVTRASAVRFVTVKHGSERDPKIRQYDLLWPNMDQKEPSRFGSTVCYGKELARNR